MFSDNVTAKKNNVNLINLFKPNEACTNLIYTESGDVESEIALESDWITHRDVSDLNQSLHSTINHNENIIPPNTLLPSVTSLFSQQRTNQMHTGYNPEIDGTEIPSFKKPKASNPFEFCLVRGVMSMAMGYVGGGFFALFMNAFQNPIPWELQDKLSTKEQLVYSYKDLVRNMKRLGKQMAIIGGLYGTIECVIEKKRAKQDIDNHLYAGCLTGGLLGASGGPYAACMGCGGFAAFSWIVETYMSAEIHPEQEDDENTRNYQQMLVDDLNWM